MNRRNDFPGLVELAIVALAAILAACCLLHAAPAPSPKRVARRDVFVLTGRWQGELENLSFRVHFHPDGWCRQIAFLDRDDGPLQSYDSGSWEWVSNDTLRFTRVSGRSLIAKEFWIADGTVRFRFKGHAVVLRKVRGD